jgi:hypothetical protein
LNNLQQFVESGIGILLREILGACHTENSSPKSCWLKHSASIYVALPQPVSQVRWPDLHFGN